MRRAVRAFGAVVPVALRRLRAQWLLYSCALVALTLAVTVAALVPFYAEAASLRLLERELAQAEQRSGRSPFALLIRFLGANSGPQPWARVAPVDDLISGPGLPFLGLPIDGFARHGRSTPFPLVLAPPGAAPQALGSATLGFLDGMDASLRLVDGALPPTATIGGPVEVLVARSFANRAGLNVGDPLTLRATAPLQLRIAGIWEPVNPDDPAWFYTPEAFESVLLVPEAGFVELAATTLPVDQMVWFIQMRATGLTPAQAAPLLGRVETLGARVAGGLPGTRIEQGPVTPLTTYRQLVAALLVQLGVLAAAPLAMAALFLALVTGALTRRQQGEVALMKTRGVRSSQILGLDLSVWLLLGAFALPAGLMLGALSAQLLGQVRSFLLLAPNAEPLVLSWSPTALLFGLAALLVGLLAALLPAWFATRRTLLQEQRQQSRVERVPLWQRAFLDVVLLALGGYGLWTARGNAGSGYTDPLRVLLPLILSVGLALLVLRLLPILLALGARLAARTRSVVALVVLRTLARQPASYRSVVLLLIVTLSIATVSATLARTLDADLASAISYQVGADTQLIETGEQQEENGQPPAPGEARFLFVPVSARLTVPGVLAAARVGRFEATLQLGGAAQPAQLVGVDRNDFAAVARWDPAWANGQELNALLNQLATRPQAVLVSRAVAERGVQVGQPLALDVTVLGERRPVRGQVAGVVDLWPGVYPEDGPFVIANLPAIFEQLGDQYPYDVWIERDPAIPLAEVEAGVRQLGVLLVDTRDETTLLAAAAAEPRRQGLFGMLSLGFGAAALLTLIGFVLMALLNARRRAVELGVLAALGLLRWRLVAALALEQGLLVLAGVASGSAIGVTVATLTVPLLRVGVGPHPGTPPTPLTEGGDTTLLVYAAGAAALLLAVLALAFVASRLPLAQAVRLGDATE